MELLDTKEALAELSDIVSTGASDELLYGVISESQYKNLGPDVGDELHKQLCDQGFIQVQQANNPYATVNRCPRCVRDRRLAKLESDLLSAGVGHSYTATEWGDLELVAPLDKVKAVSADIPSLLEARASAIFLGPSGSGKTQAAVLLVKHAIRSGYTAGMVNLGRAAMDIRAGYSDNRLSEADLVDRLSAFDLLVLDDFGAGETGKASTALEERLLYAVLETRRNAGRASVITANLNDLQLAEKLGTRLLDRLEPYSTLEFKHGKNFRQERTLTPWD